jgi:hypothetical protein
VLRSPLSTEKIYDNHINERKLQSCSDVETTDCQKCLSIDKARYCRYDKAFTVHKCCLKSDRSGLCGSSDPDVICTDSIEGLQKYEICLRDSL